MLPKLLLDCQIHALDVAHRQAEKDAASCQRQLEHSQVQHQKQVNEVKTRCSALQAERNALTMAMSAVAAELVRINVCSVCRLIPLLHQSPKRKP